jgi:nitroreductase
VKILTEDYPFIPYFPETIVEEEMMTRSRGFYHHANKRRSIRHFSNRPIPRQIVENIVRTAGTAPSGANKQPWTFVVVSDPKLKLKIRIAAEIEEKEFYERKIPDEWRKDLAPLGTDWKKPYLEIAPIIIVVFRQVYSFDTNKTKRKHYFVMESVGIAVGMLITAIHNSGLVTLTHTPSPMKFLREILNRPINEKPFVLMPVGYPAENVTVPDIKRKKLSEIMVWK